MILSIVLYYDPRARGKHDGIERTLGKIQCTRISINEWNFFDKIQPSSWLIYSRNNVCAVVLLTITTCNRWLQNSILNIFEWIVTPSGAEPSLFQ